MKGEAGYWFALPRLLARLAGRRVRRAQWSGWEAYGLGTLVFGIGCVALGHLFCTLVRPGPLRWLALLLTPGAIWIACLLVYFVNWLLAKLLRRLGFLARRPVNPVQSFVILALVSALAAGFLRADTGWLRSLGAFWGVLLMLNACASIALKIWTDAKLGGSAFADSTPPEGPASAGPV